MAQVLASGAKAAAAGMHDPSDTVPVTDDPDDAVMRVLECYERRCAEMPAAAVKAEAQ